jgi:hypothetical protein
MQLAVAAFIILGAYLVIRYFVGGGWPQANALTFVDKCVFFVVAVLLIAWFFCFVGLWCPPGGTHLLR